jgi:hypothetical protein
MRYPMTLLSVFGVLLMLAGPANADEIVKHSGVIVAIADDATVFMLAEIGPWQVRNGATVTTHRIITLLPQTQFAMVERVDDAPSGFRGDFVEVPLGPDAVYLHDYVTVECRHQGSRLLALKITVMELPAGDKGEQMLR